MNLADGIVLLCKTPGPTSFSSLNSVKKALNTKKVGHTGTLDSFASGLLVVCTGRLTKLAGKITGFNKTYEAVIKFGEETDTCEYTGNVIRKTSLPNENDLRSALEKWSGNIMQKPPLFSAIHIDGKRASDLARSGKEVEIPERPVTVFHSEIKELKFSKDDSSLVEYAHIVFSVSKGTYIRSLARDIAKSAGSAAHLVGLFRTKVGNFCVEDSAGFGFMPQFGIDSAIEIMESQKAECNTNGLKNAKNRENVIQNDDLLKKEIVSKKQNMTRETAKMCGFEVICLKNHTSLEDFKNGKPLRQELFETSLWDCPKNSEIAVFFENEFAGLVLKNEDGKTNYGFVV